MLNAIILAGDSNNSPIISTDSKAMIKIKGKFMIEYVIDSLRSASNVDKIVVVGDRAILEKAIGNKVDCVLEGEGSILKNMRAGIDFLSDTKHVLVCTSDIPMVSSEAIDDFIIKCMERKVDIGYPIIDKSLNDIKYPDVKRTYVRMKDGTYTGGNIIYINPSVMEPIYYIAEELVENRKNALKMGRVFGACSLLKLSLGILSIESVEKRVKKRFGINARAIKTQYPEIGNDVDKVDDVDFVNKYLSLGV